MNARALRRAVVVASAAALAAAFVFGAWHVLVGGGLHGNPRAAAFGLALSVVSGAGLAVVVRTGRRSATGRA